MLYYVIAMVENAPQGNFDMQFPAKILNTLPRKIHINACWKCFNVESEAKEFQKSVNAKRVWHYPIW